MSKPDRYHLVGVAGVGMSALAEAARARGWRVSGSDRHIDQGQALPVLEKLAAAGVERVRQDGSAVGPDCDAVVVSTAIEDDNPDVSAARARGIPVWHRSELLARLIADGRPSVAIAGTSGKSTVTGMVGWLLACAGRDPFVVNGAPVLNWMGPGRTGSVRAGSGPWVFEADESDRSLMRYHPDWAVITNVSADHFPLAEAEALLRAFAGQVRRGLVSTLHEPGLTAGLDVTLQRERSVFEVDGTRFEVNLPGRHNAENALLAVSLCRRMGCDLPVLAAGLRTFGGIERRLQFVDEVAGVRIYDDYGHNPAKIRAAWDALVPHARAMRVVWRPHGYGPLRAMREDLIAAFDTLCGADNRVWVLPVYDAGGTADRRAGSREFVAAARSRGVPVAEVGNYDAAVAAVSRACRDGDTVLVMGARDPALPDLARRIGAALS